jgi:hypothetical protein
MPGEQNSRVIRPYSSVHRASASHRSMISSARRANDSSMIVTTRFKTPLCLTTISLRPIIAAFAPAAADYMFGMLSF